jgi:hypothetical protein
MVLGLASVNLEVKMDLKTSSYIESWRKKCALISLRGFLLKAKKTMSAS